MPSQETQLNPENLQNIYRQGYFPMADGRNDKEIYLVRPPIRCLLPIAEFHISRRLRRRLRQTDYSVEFNADFAKTIAACAETKPNRSETWINAEIEHSFIGLHRQGLAHSVEVYDSEHTLIGGLYGLAMGGAFFGESMFSYRADASKLALCHLVAHLHHGGFTLLDAQFHNPHLEQFGAYELSHADYMGQLKRALKVRARMPSRAQAAVMGQFLCR